MGTEFVFVVAVAFGGTIAASIVMMLKQPLGALAAEPKLWGIVLQQAVILGVLGMFLYARDWTPKRLGLTATWTDAVWTLVLLGGVYDLAAIASYAMGHLSWLNATPSVSLLPSDVSPMTIFAVVLVNPFFEEVFVTGYVITVLKDVRGATFAINASVVIRLACHLYQGTAGVLMTIPMGLIFGYWFARKGRLWPLIVAHAAMNLVVLLHFLPN
jgi:membrane protease YdiL (CAAX protease family)